MGLQATDATCHPPVTTGRQVETSDARMDAACFADRILYVILNIESNEATPPSKVQEGTPSKVQTCTLEQEPLGEEPSSLPHVLSS